MNKRVENSYTKEPRTQTQRKTQTQKSRELRHKRVENPDTKENSKSDTKE